MVKRSILLILIAILILIGNVGCSKKNEDIDVNLNRRADIEENGDSGEIGDAEPGQQEDEELEEPAEGIEDSQAADGGEPDQEEPADETEEEKVADDIKDESKEEEPKKDKTEPRTKVNANMWAKSNVNFRKGADTDSNIIKVLTLGTKVKVMEKTANGWYYIESGGSKGYVSANYLSSTEIEQAKAEPKKQEPKKEEPKKEEPKKEEPKKEEPKKEEPKKEEPEPDPNKTFPIPSNLPSGAKYTETLTGPGDIWAMHYYSYSKNLSGGSKIHQVISIPYDSGNFEIMVKGYNKDEKRFTLEYSSNRSNLRYISGGTGGGATEYGELDSWEEIEEVWDVISAFRKAYGK